MLRQPSVLLVSSGTVPRICSPHSSDAHVTPSRHLRPLLHCPRLSNGQRAYARPSAEQSPNAEKPEDFQWPEPSPSNGIPTPYEIFKMKKGAPYSKRRFFELVKIYHPDRDRHAPSGPGCVSKATRIERYRLIIDANEILSDNARRKAYDSCGAGWNGRPDPTAWRRSASNSWSNFDDQDSPARNATWEDWERWYEHGPQSRSHPPPKQRPVSMSNGSFVLLIVAFTLLASFEEMRRAGRMSQTMLQQLEARHDEASKGLGRTKREAQGCDSNGARVERFLRTRETGKWGNEETSVPQELRVGGNTGPGRSNSA